ncbi:ribose operon repressor [Paraliobacillus ryukyuensis]|uniref:LacI family transcriptional regulator n=1 Tax=Paraliobacillus ryukyuensis TaxID=200904 RepID=A0A366DTY9_9BACI|nr:LacI family DNA-binding transcriptional regulator [Paraliobacillus ryukyuensis]RBO93556.1 LacI family transcriptional regulator [Paraliobacillus ryukyuensis]
MATIKDVAKLAGVALSTASYALNDNPRISEATKQRVLDAAKALNYQKNGFASDLKRTKTNTIALILSDLSGPYYSDLIRGVQDVCTSNGYDFIACSSIGGDQSTAIKFLKEKRVDGAIILAHNISDETCISYARKDFPLVVLDRKLQHDFIYHVEVDNVHGGYIAANHLIEKGHKDIAYISGPTNSFDNKQRFKGYQQALREHELVHQSKWNFVGNFTKEGGYRATKLLVAQRNLPTAIFFANDEMAIGGVRALQEQKYNVPRDISIIGFDDIELSEYLPPGLTTIKQPKYEAGALSVHLIFQVLAGGDVDNYYRLSTEFIERNSVKKLASKNE